MGLFNKKKYPKTKIFENVGEPNRKLHSQSNQDYIVYENFFKDKKDGFFCDIGGNRPLKINNTLYFEELGWEGVAFEPLPNMGELWKKHRRAKLFPVALSDSEGEVDFTVVKNVEVGKICFLLSQNQNLTIMGIKQKKSKFKKKFLKKLCSRKALHISIICLRC